MASKLANLPWLHYKGPKAALEMAKLCTSWDNNCFSCDVRQRTRVLLNATSLSFHSTRVPVYSHWVKSCPQTSITWDMNCECQIITWTGFHVQCIYFNGNESLWINLNSLFQYQFSLAHLLTDCTAVAILLGRKYHRCGHDFIYSFYEIKNDFGKNMTWLWSFVADNRGPLWSKVIK